MAKVAKVAMVAKVAKEEKPKKRNAPLLVEDLDSIKIVTAEDTGSKDKKHFCNFFTYISLLMVVKYCQNCLSNTNKVEMIVFLNLSTTIKISSY